VQKYAFLKKAHIITLVWHRIHSDEKKKNKKKMVFHCKMQDCVVK